MSDQITEVFAKTCNLLLKRGYKDLDQVEGCIEQAIDEEWDITFNPHKAQCKDSNGSTVPPYGIVVKHKSFPVGVIGPMEGALLEGAETDFIAALDVQLAAE